MNSSGIDAFLAGMFGLDGDRRAGSFEVDFAALEFIEPVGVVVLANAIEAVYAQGCTVTLTNTARYQPAISYLDDSGFFKLYTGHPIRVGATVRGTTVPLQRVSHAQSYYWLESQFVSWLASRLSMAPEALASIHACMKEIFINIDNHSGTNIGCIYMQHFPNKNEIVVAVSDFGVGIPTAIRRAFPKLPDAHAIHHASLDGVTSRTTRGNRGIGLDFLIRTVVSTNKGKVHIHSGRGKLSCKVVAGREARVPWEAPSFFPGTLIEVRLRTDAIVPDETDRETLVW